MASAFALGQHGRGGRLHSHKPDVFQLFFEKTARARYCSACAYACYEIIRIAQIAVNFRSRGFKMGGCGQAESNVASALENNNYAAALSELAAILSASSTAPRIPSLP